jgi:hypothetical protein
LAERARWTRSETVWAAGCLSFISLVVLLALLLIANTIAGAPPLHDIHTAGAQKVSYQIADYSGRIVWGPTTPTMSLDEFRCEAWRQSRQGICPDAAELSRTLWPQLQQTPATLYVGVMWRGCLPSPGHFNIEYLPGTLLMHCYEARPWFMSPLQIPEGARAARSIVLVTVSLTEIPSGKLQVVYEDRVERWLFDAVETFQLGVVTLPH